MYRNYLATSCYKPNLNVLFKLLIMVKISALIIMLSFMQASATVHAQKASIKADNAALTKIFTELRKQTGYHFIYLMEDMREARPVSIHVRNAPLQTILDNIFANQPLTYEIRNKRVLVERKKTLATYQAPDTREILDIIVSGKVIDEEGRPLQGVSVSVKNSSLGAYTDGNGSFQLTIPKAGETLVFTIVGFKPKEVVVSGNTTLNITLEEDLLDLDEVVVVGYGTQKKSNLTGAIDVVDGEMLANRPAPNVAMLVQGASPNTNIVLNNMGGEPGASQRWNIRGVGSINSDAQPLILVDGVEANPDFLDPESIESISVLKDASASAVYGSRAAFGVIMITTKKGAKNQPVSIQYSNNTSFTVPIYVPRMENSLVYATAFNQAATNANVTPTFPADQVDRIKGYLDGTYTTEYDPNKPPYSQWRGRWDGNANYDWTRMYYKDYSIYQKHNVSASGGDKKNQYYVNAGIFDQPGLYSWGDDGYKRYNILANLNSQIADWVSFNFSAKYGKTKTNAPIGMVGLERTYTWSQFIDFWPTMPMYNIDGSVANPLVLVLEQGGRIITENNDLWLNIGTEIEPVKGWKTNIYYRYNNRWGTSDRNPKPVPVPIPNGTTGNIGEATTGFITSLSQGDYYQLGAFTSYEKQLGGHYFKALVGYEQDKSYDRLLAGSKMNLITDQVPSINTATGDFTLRDRMSHWATQGVFGRLNYNYNEKYLFEFSARYDGSSKFAPGSRWGFFPSASVGYNMAKENFWAPLEPYINTFKLRGSYGSLGNQRVTDNLFLPTINVQYRRNADNYANPGYIIGNEVPLYATMPGIVTDGLTWETITTLDLGLDAGFLNNRLNLTFDWYNRVTSDMMGAVLELPSLLGTGVPLANNATLSTKGLELSLAWQDRLSSNFSYDARLTVGRSRTVITDYLAEAVNINGWYKGKVFGEIWGLTTDRIMQDKDESMPDQTAYHNNWGAGDIIYKDLNGDGVINEGSRTLDDHGDLSVIANTTPKFNYGIMAGFRWKNLDFNMFWQGIGKRDFLPQTHSEYFWGLMAAPNNSGIFKGGKMLDYWRPADETNMLGPNTDSYFPRPYFSAERNKNIRDQSRYVLNAAYLRLKNLQVGYTIPPKVLQRVFINRARVYFSAENLLTFSKLPKMYEPETAVASSAREDVLLNSSERGIDMGEIYPINQMFSFGVNLTF